MRELSISHDWALDAGEQLLYVIVGIYREMEEVMLASFLAFSLSQVFNYRPELRTASLSEPAQLRSADPTETSALEHHTALGSHPHLAHGLAALLAIPERGWS